MMGAKVKDGANTAYSEIFERLRVGVEGDVTGNRRLIKIAVIESEANKTTN